MYESLESKRAKGDSQGPIEGGLCSPGPSSVLTASIHVMCLASSLRVIFRNCNVQPQDLSLAMFLAQSSSEGAACSSSPGSPGATLVRVGHAAGSPLGPDGQRVGWITEALGGFSTHPVKRAKRHEQGDPRRIRHVFGQEWERTSGGQKP